MKKLVALLLALMLLMSATALAGGSWTERIAPEGETIKLTLGMNGTASTGSPEKLWFWEYCRREMGIDFEVEVTQDNASYVSLAFASDSVPDVMLATMTAADIVRYGQEEGMLLDFTPYITEEYMPNFFKMVQEHPEYLESIKTPDGKVYSMPLISDAETITGVNATGTQSNYFINQVWLQEVGMESPKTLDDLYALLVAFKEKYPDCTPMGGCYEGTINPGYIILNALGYTGTDDYGFQVSLRNGKTVVPFGDREVFGEYLKIMNRYYTEGLIAKDYFTMDDATVNAKMAEGKMGLIPRKLMEGLKEGSNFKDYWGGAPLTSAYKDAPSWGLKSNGVKIGNCSLSVNCSNVEAAVRWVDWFFDENSTGMLLEWIGPTADETDLLYGMTTGYDFDLASGARVYRDVTNGKWGTVGELVQGEVAGFSTRFGNAIKRGFAGYVLSGNTDQYVELVYDDANAAQPWQWEMYSLQENLMQYLVSDYPTIVFFSEEENTEVADLKIPLENYATQEIAKFITNDHEPTDEELTAYFDALDAMGFQDYLGYYASYYENLTK